MRAVIRNLLPFVILFLLTACTPAAAPVATQAPAQTATATPAPTDPPAPTQAPADTPTPEPTAEPVGIVYFAYFGGAPHREWEKENVLAFMAAHPKIAVDGKYIGLYANPVPGSIDGRMTYDPPPDVISGFMGGLFLDYVRAGLIADISDLWEENGWFDVFPQSVIDMAGVDGRQYFVPTMLQFHPVWYNTEVFARYGTTPPGTWEDMLVVCDTLSAAGQTPFTVSIAGWNAPTARWFTYLNLRLNGPDFHNSLMRGEQSWLDDRIRTVFDYWQQLFDHGCFADNVANTGYGTAAGQINDGDAAMYLLGEWLSESYPDGMPEHIDFFPFPVIDPAVPLGEAAHQYGAFLHAGAAHPEEGRAFLAWLGSAAVHDSFGAVLNRVSPRTGLDLSLFDERYLRGIELVAGAPQLTSLFELGTNAAVAQQGLDMFADFFRNPGSLEANLEEIEAARLAVYGPLP